MLQQTCPIGDTLVDVSFRNVANGMYAIAIYHDENSDRQLNTKKLGVPSEGVGFSGELKSKLKPPDFKEASFMLHRDTTIYIRMRYTR